MNALPETQRRRPEWFFLPVSILVLAFCFYYTFALAFQAPYPGLSLNTEWIVVQVDACEGRPDWCEGGPLALQTGDQLRSIGSLTFDEYTTDRRRVLFGGYGPGDQVQVSYEREGLTSEAKWRMPPVTSGDRLPALRGVVFFLPFWLSGTTALLLLQPRDKRWLLLIFWSYLTAIWLAAGMASGVGVGASSLVLHAVTWLMVPIYLQLHQLVPNPIFQRAGTRTHMLMNGTCTVLAILELFQLLPNFAYMMALAVVALGSVGLLLWRFVDRGSVSSRPATRLMLAGIGLALVPGLALELGPQLLGLRMPGAYTVAASLIVVPVFPLAYTYAIFRRFLGTLEFRVNRLLTGYAFILTYGTAYIVVYMAGHQGIVSSGGLLVLNVFVSLLFVILAPSVYGHVQRIVGRLAYGTVHHPDQIVRTFANRIPATLNIDDLSELLIRHVLPSLLIRQSALYSLQEGSRHLAYAHGVNQPASLEKGELDGLLLTAKTYRPVLTGPSGSLTELDSMSWDSVGCPTVRARRNSGGVVAGSARSR